MKFNKDAQVSARLHESTKQKLYKTGYNAADAIEWFVSEWYSNNPKRKVAIQKDMLEIKLDQLKKLECEVQVEIGVIEKQLEEFVVSDVEEVVPEEIPFKKEVLPDKLQQAVDRIKPVYEDKKEMFVSPNVPIEDSLDVFITLNGDFVRNVYQEFGKGLKWKDFKELLLEEVVNV